jgi:NAD(P)-dependent dehydrogenase (short-subunit alcohol dehydrogenase family)
MNADRAAQPLSRSTALITGGDRGIGQAICLRLAELGADVAFLYLQREDDARATFSALERLGIWVVSYKTDVTDPEAVDRTVRDLISKAPMPLKIVVNNAGITRDRTVANMTLSDWNEVVATNLTGAFNIVKAVLPELVRNGYGRIINIASIIGQTGGFGQANYAASKAGLIAFTRTLALELSRKNITANAVAPGWIDTSMLAEVPSKVQAALLGRIPLGRFGEPASVAEAVGWLCLPSSGYVTGQTICVNGGAYFG